MSEITADTVAHLASLARIDLTAEEIEHMIGCIKDYYGA